MNKFSRISFFILTLIFISGITGTAQQSNAGSLTTEDYQRAEKAMAYNTSQLVDHGSARPNWLPDERFWYRVLTAQGSEFILVDPARGTRAAAFDHQKLAAALSAAAGEKYEASRLPFLTISYSPEGSILFNAAKKKLEIQSCY